MSNVAPLKNNFPNTPLITIPQQPIISPAPPQQAPVPQQTIISPPILQKDKMEHADKKTQEKTDVNSENNANYVTIKAPIIGTFYRRSSPEKDPFVNVGDKIEKEV